MADVKPFRGHRFALDEPEDLGLYCAPPYDMIDDATAKQLYGKHPHNIVRVTQNIPEPTDSENKDRHVRAAQFLNDWINNKIVAKDETDSIYVYRQKFTADGTDYERAGVCALVKLVGLDEQIVVPHEYTLSGPKQDRYELMETTLANTGQIFGLADDRDDNAVYNLIREIIAATTPVGSFADNNGVIHTLHKCSDSASIEKFVALMKSRNILIADGHHRYETALRFYRDRGDEAFSHVMMTLVSTADPGLVIRPFHRLVRKTNLGKPAESMKEALTAYFDVTPIGTMNAQVVANALALSAPFPNYKIVFWDCASGKGYGLKLNANGKAFIAEAMPERSDRWRKLDVSKINCAIIGGILGLPLDGHVLHDVVSYVNDIDDGAARLSAGAGEFYGGFFIRPVSIGEIADIVRSGERMPQKSTNFFPKIYSGLVFNVMRQ